MAFILENVWNGWKYLCEDNGDIRTRNFILIKNPGPVFAIVSFYLYFCISLGPRLMKDRKPFVLKNVLILYNAFQVLYSSYLVYLGTFAYVNNYSFYCQPLDHSTDPVAIKLTEGAWLYFFAKITELLDTIFFVLRKKNNQVTFLHIYHHATMPIFAWIGVKYFPSGHSVLLGWLNSMVHVFMYFYYFIAGLGPEYQKYLWWKKHITTLQLAQFSIFFVHNLIPLLTDCPHPKSINVLVLISSSLFLYMFGKFYIDTYVRNKGTNKKLSTQKVSGKILNGSTYSNGNGAHNNYKNGHTANGHGKVD